MTITSFGPMLGHVSGRWATKEVWIDGHLISPAKSLRLINHSPDGFNWSYAGSGPAQLALAILLELAGQEFALEHYQAFKREFIAPLPPTNFAFDIASVKQWIVATQSLAPSEGVQS